MDHLPSVAGDSIPGLIEVIEARDGFTAGHSANVGRLCRRVAREMGWSPEQVAEAHVAGLVHDLGRIGLPDAVLTAPGRLAPGQWDLMRRHPDRGAEILSVLGLPAVIVDGVRTHHERWDGSGYPAGLRGPETPPLGRLLALCESFDAMTARRPQGRAKPASVARAEIALDAGILYDIDMTEALLDVVGAADPGEPATADFGEEWERARRDAGSTGTSFGIASERSSEVLRTPVDKP